MFIGHYGAGFALKRFSPDVSLGVFFMAALWADLLWPVFLLLGVERLEIVPGATKVVPFDFVYYPFSHSLVAVVLWAGCFGLAYYALRRRMRGALFAGAAVLSHWFLDAIVHRPDLPIGFTAGARAGLGLWNSVAGTIAVEGGIFIIGVLLYLSSTRPVDKTGQYGTWALIVLLTAVYAGQFSGAVPPNQTVVAFTGLTQWLPALFGFWTDAHRGPAD